MKNLINRRKFFGLTAITTVGAAIFANSPLKYFDRSNRIKINKKVTLHPGAVKRTK